MNFFKSFFAALFIFFLLFNYAGFSQVIKDSSYYIKAGQIIQNWELFEKDDLAIKDSTFPPSGKTVKSIVFNVDSFDLKHLSKIIWFRKKFQIDSSLKNKA